MPDYLWETCQKNIKDKLRFKHFYVNLFFNSELTSVRKLLHHTSILDTNPLDNNAAHTPSRSTRATEPPIASLLSAMIHHPLRVLMLWNWKSALLSIILRGPIFFVAALRQGWKATVAAVLTETIFCALSAGFYGAIVQSLKDAEPEWLTGIFLAGVLPLIFQGLEYLLHWFRGTPHLRVAEIVSLFVSALSALFNWYAMRRGTLLVGGEGGTFGGDLRRLPRLLLGFLVHLPRKLFRRVRNLSFKLSTGRRSDIFLGS